MADEINATVTTTPDTAGTEVNTPSTEELMAQIAQLTSDRDKYKTANDKLSKEAAEAKRRERDRMSEEEKQAEAQRARDEQFEQLLAENNRMKAFGAYKDIPDEKVVGKLIDAVSDADHTAIAKIISDECKKAVAEAEKLWLGDRPRVNLGATEKVITRKDISAIKDGSERRRLIAENMHLYETGGN